MISNIKKGLQYLLSFTNYKYRHLDKEFYAFSELLNKNEKLEFEEMQVYQYRQLKTLLSNAYNFSEFYQKKYSDFGFHPDDFKSLEDINKIPALSKDEVKNNADLILLNNFKGKIYSGHTSGTTGKALTLYFDKNTLSREWASICYQWYRIGFDPKEGRVEFRGFIADDNDFIYLPLQNILRVNIIKMNDKNIEKIVNKIKKLQYKYIHGYPSAIYKFSKILNRKELSLKLIKGIFLASEIVYDWQLNLIDRVFDGVEKIAHYGQAEKSILGAWYNDRRYHFIPSYGLVEVNKENNELIGTGFINDIFPLIRYKLNDTIKDIVEAPIFQGINLFPIIPNIEGRQEDYTYNWKGDLIPPAIVTFPFKKLHYINACKIIQNKIDSFDLLIEAKENNDSVMEADILIKDLKTIYGQETKFNKIFISQIPVDKSGKFRWIESKIVV